MGVGVGEEGLNFPGEQQSFDPMSFDPTSQKAASIPGQKWLLSRGFPDLSTL